MRSPRLPREMKKYEDRELRVSRPRHLGSRSNGHWASGRDSKACSSKLSARAAGPRSAHLADGDVILAIDGDAVADVAAVQQKMERVARDKPRAVVMKVRRGIRTFFVEMQTVEVKRP